MPRVVRGYKETARSQIVEAALEVFASKGYHGSTMEDIAKKLGVSKGAIYLYFRSKEDLLREIQASTRQRVVEQLKQAFESKDPEKGVEVFFDSIFQASELGLHNAFDMFSLAAHNEKLRKILREDHDNDLKMLTDFLNEQIRKGTINPKIDKRFLAPLFVGISFEILVELVLGYDKSTIRKEWVETVSALLATDRQHSA